jgi:hypothetical protein
MTILDLLNIKFESLSVDDFKITFEGENMEGKKFFDYEKKINPKAFGIFDTLQLKIFSNRFKVSNSTLPN